MGKLATKLTDAVDAKVVAAERIADILRREPRLDPNDEDKVFMIFKTRRFARLFAKKVCKTDQLDEVIRKER